MKFILLLVCYFSYQASCMSLLERGDDKSFPEPLINTDYEVDDLHSLADTATNQAMLDAVNQQRAANGGLSPLCLNS
jgi:hypothetical protein